MCVALYLNTVQVCVCVPVRPLLCVNSSEALAPSDGPGCDASDWTDRQRHGGQSS